MCTDFCTLFTSDTQILIDMRFSCAVHFHLSCTGTASHTDILQCTAETGRFMTFKMTQRNENICVHNGTTDLGFFYVFAACHRNQFFIGSFQTIRDQNLTAGCN